MASLGARQLDHYERRLHAEGFDRIAGVDEAGRGALAGPLVAAAVILPQGFGVEGLRDSKLLTALQRDRWFDRIRAAALAYSVCRVFPRRIDARGLHVSNLALLRRALYALDVVPDFVLMDGFSLPGMRFPHLAIRKGDVVTASVAAASVIAKVTRDRIMDRYHRRFPEYGFDQNRGYGTDAHRAAIVRCGPSPVHRMSFKGLKLYAQDVETYAALYGEAVPAGETVGGITDDETRTSTGKGEGDMSDEDIERYEDDMEMRLWREYRDVLPMFSYVVETERRFYLTNGVDLVKHEDPGGPWFELELNDAWVWDMYRPARFVTHVRVLTTNDVNIEELVHKDPRPEDALGDAPAVGDDTV